MKWPASSDCDASNICKERSWPAGLTPKLHGFSESAKVGLRAGADANYREGNNPLSGEMCCKTPIEIIGESVGLSAAH